MFKKNYLDIKMLIRILLPVPEKALLQGRETESHGSRGGKQDSRVAWEGSFWLFYSEPKILDHHDTDDGIIHQQGD
jgi:hypothetical protein